LNLKQKGIPVKLLSYLHQGQARWGQVVGDEVVDLSSPACPTLRCALAAGRLDEIVRTAAASGARAALKDIEFLPVIPDAGKIFCVGHNYEAHRVETQRDKTEHPLIFLRVAESQCGHRQPLLLPPESSHLDYEGEIAVIIGKAGRRIRREQAWAHVAGYSAYNEGSIRDWQRHTLQFTAGKNFSSTGGFGPWMVTRGEIADGEELTLETRLNGEVMQHTTTALMIFPIPVLIEYISTFTTLQPGDVIVSGTPGGVGAKRTPPVWMKAGDRVEIEVSKIGVLVNPIVAETP
jgi:2-keto-4-pentenoate hydratase/2-oxohepta-3-ene-1,7-dioic acid hydratase in catechol pathway